MVWTTTNKTLISGRQCTDIQEVCDNLDKTRTFTDWVKVILKGDIKVYGQSLPGSHNCESYAGFVLCC